MVQYLHFRILKFPLTDLELTLVVSRSWTISIAWQVFAPSIEKSQLHYQVPLQRTPSHAHLMLQTCNMPAGMGSRRARKRQTCVFCSYFWQKIAVIKKNISENLNLVWSCDSWKVTATDDLTCLTCPESSLSMSLPAWLIRTLFDVSASLWAMPTA
jgi:hypothetical protein